MAKFFKEKQNTTAKEKSYSAKSREYQKTGLLGDTLSDRTNSWLKSTASYFGVGVDKDEYTTDYFSKRGSRATELRKAGQSLWKEIQSSSDFDDETKKNLKSYFEAADTDFGKYESRYSQNPYLMKHAGKDIYALNKEIGGLITDSGRKGATELVGLVSANTTPTASFKKSESARELETLHGLKSLKTVTEGGLSLEADENEKLEHDIARAAAGYTDNSPYYYKKTDKNLDVNKDGKVNVKDATQNKKNTRYIPARFSLTQNADFEEKSRRLDFASDVFDKKHQAMPDEAVDDNTPGNSFVEPKLSYKGWDAKNKLAFIQDPRREKLFNLYVDQASGRADGQQEGEWYKTFDSNTLFPDDFDYSAYALQYQDVPLTYINEQEAAIARYIYNTEGEQAFNEYVDNLTPILNQRRTERIGVDANRFASETGFMGSALLSAASMAPQLGSGIGAVEDIINYASGKKLDVNSNAHLSANYANAYRGAVRGEIDSKYGDTASDAYSIGMSIADFAYTTLVSKGLGSAFNMSAKGVQTLALNLQSSSAATNSIINAKNSGLSDKEAVNLGVVAYAAEYISEKIQWETLFNNSGKGLVRYIVENMAAEGGEELLSQGINDLGEFIVRKGKSHYEDLYNQYIAEGMSESEANKAVWSYAFEEYATAGIGGMVSGGVIGGVYGGANAVNTHKAGRAVKGSSAAVEQLKNLGSVMSAESVAYKLAGKIDENSSAYQIGRAFNEIGAELSEQEISTLTDKLTDKGMAKSNATVLVEALQATMQGAELTDSQRLALENNTVLTETVQDLYSKAQNYNEITRLANEAVRVAEAEKTIKKGTRAVNSEARTVTKAENALIKKYADLAEVKAQAKTEGSTQSFAEALTTDARYTTDEDFKALADEYIGAKGKAGKAQFALEFNKAAVEAAKTNLKTEAEQKDIRKAENIKVREAKAKAKADSAGFNVSKDGRTQLVSTGENVSVQRVHDNGMISVKHEDGTVSQVNMEEVAFENDNMATAYAVISDMAVPSQYMTNLTRNLMLNSDVSVGAQAEAMAEAFGYGEIGLSVDKVKTLGVSDVLTEGQLKFAVELGQQNSTRNTQRAEREVQVKKEKALEDMRAELKHNRAKGKKGSFKHDFTEAQLEEMKAESKEKYDAFKTAEVLSQLLPVEIYVIDTAMDKWSKYKGTNGFYENSIVYVDINASVSVKNGEAFIAENTMLFTLSHELVHYIKDWSPAKYKVLSDFVLGEFAKEGELETVVNKKIEELKDISGYYKNLNAAKLREAALEEVVAEACQRMLVESDAVERLAELRSRDESLFKKFKSFIANFFNRVVQRYKNLNPQGYEAQLVDKIPEMAEKMKVLFSDALVTAAENQRIAGAQKNTARSGVYSTSIKFQNMGSYPYDMQTVIVEYLNSTDLNLIDFIFDARTETNKKRLEYMHYDIDNKISQDILSAAKDILGFDISEYKIIINGESVHHIDRRHGKNGKHDHSMKDEHDMARAKYIINNADFVKWAVDSSGKNVIDTQYRDKNNRPSKVLAFAKKINGTYFVTVASPESNKKTLHIKSMYISKKIEDTQEFDAYSPELTPEANLELPSNDSILEEAKKSNTFNEKSSAKRQRKSLDALSDSELLARHLEENSEAVGEILSRTADIEINPRVLNLLVNKKLKEYGISKDGRESVADVVPLLLDSAKIAAVKGGDITADLTSAIADAVRNTDYTENLHEEDRAEVVEALKGFKGRVYLNEGQAQHLLNNGYTFQSFRQSLFGKLNVVKESANSKTSETPFSEVYLHLSEQFPNLFVTRDSMYSDKSVDESEYALDLIEKLDSLSEEHQMRIEDVFGADANEVATHIMSELVADVVQKKYSSRKNPYVADVVEKLRAQRDRAVKKERQRASEKRKTDKAKIKERYEKREAEIKEKNAERREKAKESHAKTEMRHKIINSADELTKLLLKGTKDKNVKAGLQATVADALISVNENMDTVGAEKRLAKIKAEIDKATDPAEKAKLMEKYLNISNMGFKTEQRLSALKDAYEEIKHSDDKNLRKAYYDFIYDRIREVKEKVGNTSLRDMTMDQLEALDDLYTLVLDTIKYNDKVWKQGKREDVANLATTIYKEVQKTTDIKNIRSVISKKPASLRFGLLKPFYAFEYIGSDTFSSLFWEIQHGEEVYARDCEEARSFLAEQRKKYGWQSWDRSKTDDFVIWNGKTMSLTLGHKMDIYNAVKRKQYIKHIENGGYIFEESESFRREKTDGKKTILKYYHTPNDSYRLSEVDVANIVSTLTEEQKAYADKLEEYLTKTMGGKGNEASKKLWGIELFKEKHYTPIQTADEYADTQSVPVGEVQLKNMGSAKATVPNAQNPIVLRNYEDRWIEHTAQMSLYHALVVPIDSLNKTLNYSQYLNNGNNNESWAVKTIISAAHGKAASDYFRNWVKDLNGGVTGGKRYSNIAMKLFGNSKKVAVAVSGSTIVQQGTAVIRGMAIINPKYFTMRADGSVVNHFETIKKYAPVAIIKEMGGFDVGSNRSAVSYIGDYKAGKDALKAFATDKEYRQQRFDNAIMKGASVADEIGWSLIWDAVINEQQEKLGVKLKNLNDFAKEKFLQKCGQRFTEVIVKTQVYDSVTSRSAMMRSDRDLDKFMTAFMGEPTTSLNMLHSALVQGKRGNISRVQSARTIGAVYASIVMASAFASLVYAMRDDDEDEAFVEKWAYQFGSKLRSELNPVSMIPWARDVLTIFQGWKVSRPDMDIVQDIYDSLQAVKDDDKSAWDKVQSVSSAVASAFGIPLKNVLRDGKAICNFAEDVFDDTTADVGDIKNSFVRGISGKKQDMTATEIAEKLYEAKVSGNTAEAEELRKTYKDESSYRSALRKVLREKDPRIREAAQSQLDGNPRKRVNLTKEIVAEGHFEQDDVIKAINSEMTAILKEQSEPENNEDWELSEGAGGSYYNTDDIHSAFESGDNQFAVEIIDDIISSKIANGVREGKTQEQAEKDARSSVQSAFTRYWKAEYVSACNSNDEAEKSRIRRIVEASGLYEDTDKVLRNWESK